VHPAKVQQVHYHYHCPSAEYWTDYDRVVVTTIVKEGIPFELLNKNGHFHDMVNNTGKNKDTIWSMAEKAYLHQKH
jgi:hypothetical protein